MTPEPHPIGTLYIERIFDASPELVWKAWSEPEYAKQWWGPKAFTCPSAKMDFRVGGKYHLCMSGPMPDGANVDVWSTGVYKEIVPFKKIVCTDSFADADGNIVPSSHYGMEGFPLEVDIVITFVDLGGKTKMTLTQGMPDFMKSDATTGWNESFDKLAEMLAKG